jgi:hypothetical protein
MAVGSVCFATMVSGEGKLEYLDNNCYPDVRPVGVGTYLQNAFINWLQPKKQLEKQMKTLPFNQSDD